jgi:hypothetical protein
MRRKTMPREPSALRETLTRRGAVRVAELVGFSLVDVGSSARRGLAVEIRSGAGRSTSPTRCGIYLLVEEMPGHGAAGVH